MKQTSLLMLVLVLACIVTVRCNMNICETIRGDDTKIMAPTVKPYRVWLGTEMSISCCSRSSEAMWYDPSGKRILDYFKNPEEAERRGVFYLRDWTRHDYIQVLHLVVKNFSKEMSGQYACGDSRIEVVGRPRVLIDAESVQFLEEGHEGQVVCRPHGHGMTAFKTSWYFRDKFLKPGHDHRISFLRNHTVLRITKVSAHTDAGIYLCKANVVGYLGPQHREGSYMEIEPIKVVVFARPKLTLESPIVKSAADNKLKVAAIEGRTLELACDSVGLPPPDIYWYFNDQPIRDRSKGNGDGRVTIWESYYRRHAYSNLKIERVSTPDVGTYSCVCKVRFNNKTLAEVSKNITPEFAFHPRFINNYCNVNRTTERNRNILLNCTLSGALNDKLETSFVKESFNGRIMYFNSTVEHSRFKFATFPDNTNPYISYMTLTIYDVDTSDSGLYYCRAKLRLITFKDNRDRFYMSRVGAVHVISAPKMDEHRPVQYGLNYGKNNIECRADGYPRMHWMWTFHDRVISRRLPQYKIENLEKNDTYISVLQIRSAYSNNPIFGRYRCTAVNKVGNDSFSMVLLQASRPGRQNVHICNVDATRIKLCITPSKDTGGLPLTHYELRFMKAGQSGYEQPHYYNVKPHTVTLSHLKPNTTYKLALCAASRAGRGPNTYAEAATLPVSAPTIKLVHTSEAPDWNSFNLRWKIESDGGLPIVQYDVEIQQVKIDSWGNVVERMQPIKKMVINTLSEIKKYFRVNSLKPRTWYELRFSARNLMGPSTQQQVLFQTLDRPVAMAKSLRLYASEKAAAHCTNTVSGMLTVTVIQLLVKMYN